MQRQRPSWYAGVVLLALAAPLLAQKSPDDTKQALVDGNQRFVAGKSTAQPLGPGIRRTLARGQSPAAIVLCCADSRVPPEHVFNAGLGELFVVRVAGNCVDTEAIASIEYAAEHLGAQLLVVLGHERCGAIAAAAAMMQQANAGNPTPAESPSLQHLLDLLEPAVRRAAAHDLGGRELCNRAEEENAQAMAVEVVRRSTLLQGLQKLGRFLALPARYHLTTGEVEWLTPRPLPTEPAAAAKPVHAAAPAMAPHVALRLLQAGHRRFLGDGRPAGDISIPRREALAEGQQPFAIVVTCADSRLAPEHIFDAGLGELFVVRVAGNVLSQDVLASVEYAAAHTGASLLLVLGHSACDTVKAAAEHANDPHLTPSLRALVERLQPAVERARRGTGRELVELAVRANVQRVVAQARQQSGILRELEHEGRFTMLPAVYDLTTGDIEWLKDEPGAHAAAPAPHGETTPASGHDAPGGGRHDPHAGAPDDAHAATAADQEHEAAATPKQHGNDLSWAGHDDAHDTNAHGAAGHAAHGAPEPPGQAHGDAHAGHGHGSATHDDHGDEHQATGAPASPANSMSTAVIVLGVTGIASLIAAALLTMKPRA